MDIKRRPEPDADPEPLQRLLRHYQVGPPPAAIEDELRATFRRRASRRQRLSALAFAASVAIALGGAVLMAGLFWTRGGPAPSSSANATPPASAARPVLETAAAPAVAPLPRRAARTARQAPVRPAEPEVLVEPGQLEMLRHFARGLRDVPDAGGVVSPARDVQFRETQNGIQMPITVAPSGGEV